MRVYTEMMGGGGSYGNKKPDTPNTAGGQKPPASHLSTANPLGLRNVLPVFAAGIAIMLGPAVAVIPSGTAI